MKENIKYFETLNDANGYIINDIPFAGYIKENGLVIFNNKPNKMLIILNNKTIVYDVVNIMFDTLDDADGYIIETIPFSCYILENCLLLECNLENCKIVVENEVAVIKERGDIIRYTATSKVEPSALPTIISNDFDPNTGQGVIKFATDVTSIGVYAFENCTSLTSITIPDSVTSIGGYAFRNCTGLPFITIPDSVAVIGYYAFEGCTSLTSPVYNARIFAYMPTSYSDVYTIPDRIESITGGAFKGCAGLTSVTIPNGVTSIGGSAFYGCAGLTSVTIPNSVTSIGDQVFNNCTGLTSPVYNARIFAYMPTSYSGAYTIPDGIEIIAGAAFQYCRSLTSIEIPNSIINIGNQAFYGCSGLTSVTIPNSVTSIGNSAFSECYWLKSVTIPNSVTNIGHLTFGGCIYLTSISYTGTISQYNAITKGLNWHTNVPTTVVHCADGDTPI